MKHSDSINDLMKALVAAQDDMKPAILDCYNTFFKAKYSSMSAINEAFRKTLSKHGLAITQLIESTASEGGDAYQMTTVLCHSSGQYISSSFNLILSKKDMQGIGSASSYASRYAIRALLGIVDEEDDGGKKDVKEQTHTEARAFNEVNKAAMDRAPKNSTGAVSVTNIVKEKEKIRDEVSAREEESSRRKAEEVKTAVARLEDRPRPADERANADFRVTFGSETGKRLGELGPFVVRDKMNWIETKCKKPYSSGMNEFISASKQYLGIDYTGNL